MSFSFNHMGNNPMHAMHMMGNLSNGGNFMPPQMQQQMTAGSAQALMNQMTGMNNNPLEFNMKKNQPPGAGPMDLETSGDRDNKPERANSGLEKSHEENSRLHEEKQNRQPNLGLVQNNELLFNQMVGLQHPQGFMMMPGMMNMNMMESPLMGMQPFQMLTQQLGPPDISHQQPPPKPEDGSPKPMKEIIYCKSCTLFPPKPTAPSPKTIERPPGCRTVFVGGLPNNVTEDIVREVFERCGEITTLRLSKKNFCHIRYIFEASIDSAIYLSGYRLRIGFFHKPETDTAAYGTLHVDYAQARDDQYEYECKQRKLQREQRHRERVEKLRLRSLSPLPVAHYTDHEATSVAEKIKNDDTFIKAVQVLIAWLERGDCNKKNSNSFYSMIQCTNSHVRRLTSDKNLYEEEIARAKEHYRKQMQSMLTQFSQIEKVFNAASHKKVWDHFTKAQRKNIDAWKKQSLEIRSVQLDDFPDDDEMDMSDDERMECPSKRTKYEHEGRKERNDSFSDSSIPTKFADRSSDSKSEIEKKSLQIQVLQETIRNLQTQLLENKSKEVEKQTKITDLQEKLKEANVKQLLLKTKIANVGLLPASKSLAASSSKGSEIDENELNDLILEQQKNLNGSLSTTLDLNEAKIISLVSTFLVVHPFGASIDYIWSYVYRCAPNLRPKELEEILGRYNNLFVEEINGVGAKIERKWKFCGFDIEQDT